MRETPSLLSFVTRKIGTVDGRHIRSGRNARQTGGVVRGPGEFVVGSPELVELQSEFRTVGVGSLRRCCRRLVRDRTTTAAVVRGGGGGGGGRCTVIRRCVDGHFSIPEFPSVTSCTCVKREIEYNTVKV